MGILGVVVVLDEVELDVVLGTHLTKALGASSNASIVGERSNFKKIPTHTQDHGDA